MCIFYGSCCPASEELGSCDRDQIVCKDQNIYYLVINRKKFSDSWSTWQSWRPRLIIGLALRMKEIVMKNTKEFLLQFYWQMPKRFLCLSLLQILHFNFLHSFLSVSYRHFTYSPLPQILLPTKKKKRKRVDKEKKKSLFWYSNLSENSNVLPVKHCLFSSETLWFGA